MFSATGKVFSPKVSFIMNATSEHSEKKNEVQNGWFILTIMKYITRKIITILSHNCIKQGV